MYGFVVLCIVLGFPVLEVYTLIRVGEVVGWWVVPMLLLGAGAGIFLIQEERMAVFGRLIGAMQAGQTPFSAIFDSSRVMVAGLLLIFPGFVSDAIALLLLLWPRGASKTPVGPQPDDGVIEGEWVHVESERIADRQDPHQD
jgi:UPF0716 protein FxsA